MPRPHIQVRRRPPSPRRRPPAVRPRSRPRPPRQANALVAPNASQATAPAAGSLAPSPQAGIGCDSNKVKPAHKKCAILTWLHDLHSAKSPTCETSCQLPSPAYPTSYVACLPAPRCDCPSKPGTVLATPQAAPVIAPCAGAAPKKSCFSWMHKGMLTEFVHNLKSWRCSCPCHNAPAMLEHHGCKPCGGPAGSGKCNGIAYPWASPQASPAAPAPTGQAAQASLRAEPGDVAEGGKSSIASRPRASTNRRSVSSRCSATSGCCSIDVVLVPAVLGLAVELGGPRLVGVGLDRARSGARGGSGSRTPRRPSPGRRSRGPWSARRGSTGAGRGRGSASVVSIGGRPRAETIVGSRSTVCTSAWCRMPPSLPPGIRTISGVWISSS